jgi:hypothetical protein
LTITRLGQSRSMLTLLLVVLLVVLLLGGIGYGRNRRI